MSTGKYVRGLDGLRGLAIASVLAYHGWTYTGHGNVGRAVDVARSIGWAGVDLFFVLSGFLITGILLQTRDQPRYWRNFLIRRGLRIFPLYYAVLLTLVCGGLVLRSVGLGHIDRSLSALDGIWANFLYLTNLVVGFQGENHVPLDIAWSLALEEQFYLLFPALVLVLSRMSLGRVLVALVALAPLARALTHVWGSQPTLGPYALPYCRVDALAIGALLRLCDDGGSRVLLRRIARAAPVLGAAALAVLYAWSRKDLRFITVGYSLSAVACAALVAAVLVAAPHAPMRRAFEWRGLVYLGQISYGLYLFHLFARSGATFVLAKMFGGVRTDESWFCAAQLVAMTVLTVLVATVSFRIFERPILALKDRWAPASPAPAPVVSR